MPLNPMTGQFEYGGAEYDMPTMGAGAMAAGMGAVGADVPLAFRMMENLPGITAAALFNARRFANTMEKGGYRDVLDPSSTSKRAARRAGRAGAFAPNASSGMISQTDDAKRFLFGARRNVTGKTPFIKQSILNNFPRPRNFSRFSSLSNLSGMVDAGQYTPFQGASSFNKLFGKSKRFDKIRTNLRADPSMAGLMDEDPLFSGGIFGRLSTMGRTYNAQMRSVRAAEMRPGSMRAKRLRNKSTKTLRGIDNSLDVLGIPATKAGVQQSQIARIAATAGGVVTQSYLDDVGALLDSEILNKRAAVGLTGGKSPSAEAVSRYRRMFETIESASGKAGLADDAMSALGKKTVGKMAVAAARSGETKIAGKLATRFAGAQYAKFSGPLNVIGTASLVYDLTKMAGEGLVSAGNFAKDAVKSMQGGMRKPVFGMGFKDNEVAATSRARGVMAIQNSRLNARSMLGSEAGMMAAHFG
jgi:hypothetical protein